MTYQWSAPTSDTESLSPMTGNYFLEKRFCINQNIKMDISKISVIALSVAGTCGYVEGATRHSAHPNVVIIMTDQQQYNKMSWLGVEDLSTPTMDIIAENGITFTNAYCSFPLSIPSRFSMFTGFYPSEFNLRRNPKTPEQKSEIELSRVAEYSGLMMANLFNAAGYDTWYGGKAHLLSPDKNEDPSYYGFRIVYSTERRDRLGIEAAEFLNTRSSGGKPFLMVVSYINPHDICEYDDYVIYDQLDEKFRQKKAEGLSRVRKYVAQAEEYHDSEFYSDICPDLPENHGLMAGEPPGLPGKVADYTEEQWRMHRWVYNRLIEEVDNDIAPVITALKNGGFLDNTVIIFLSDHGDMDASHRREHKTVPFQEAQKVPFIISGPGILKGVIDTVTVINTGTDLIPTVCDLAGIAYPEDSYHGLSIAPAATGRSDRLGRRYIFTESENWFQVIEDGRYKYTVLETCDMGEILVDLENDPGEMRNLAFESDAAEIRKRLRTVLMHELESRGIQLKLKTNYN